MTDIKPDAPAAQRDAPAGEPGEGLTAAEIDAIFDAHRDASSMTFRYLVTQAIEVAVRMRVQPAADAVPAGVLTAIRHAGLTLLKTKAGYELRKFGQIEAQVAPSQPLSAQPAAAITKEALVDIVGSHLTAAYACTRVWEAWGVGTMTQDDFVPLAECEFSSDLADALLSALAGRGRLVKEAMR